MSHGDLWMRERSPAPPPDLALRLERVSADASERVAVLTSRGGERLKEAGESPGRVRGSAFLLLEADALLTYACEAALESEHPAKALRGILAAVGA